MKTRIISKLQHHFIPNAGTIIIIFFLLFAYNAWAAPLAQSLAPGVISYQGTLTDDAGQPITGNIDMTFRLYNQPTGGTALWTETHTGTNTVPVQGGQFHVLLGSLNPISSTIWANSPLYLGIQVEDEMEMMPRELVGVVPYALHADTADNLAKPVSNITLLDSVIPLRIENPATTNDNQWHDLDLSTYVPDTAKGVIVQISMLATANQFMGGKVEISSSSPTKQSVVVAVSSGESWTVDQGMVRLVDGHISYRAETKVNRFAIYLVGYIE